MFGFWVVWVSLCPFHIFELFISLPQGWTFLFQQNVGGKHLCNYLLNIRYIALCLVSQGFRCLFWLTCFGYGSLNIAQLMASCINFNFLYKFRLQKVPSLSKFHLLLCSHIYKFDVALLFILFV
jgi:hypothetical protein